MSGLVTKQIQISINGQNPVEDEAVGIQIFYPDAAAAAIVKTITLLDAEKSVFNGSYSEIELTFEENNNSIYTGAQQTDTLQKTYTGNASQVSIQDNANKIIGVNKTGKESDWVTKYQGTAAQIAIRIAPTIPVPVGSVPSEFATDTSHPLGGVKITDSIQGGKYDKPLSHGQILHQDGGGDQSFPQNHNVNNKSVYSPRTTIFANNQNSFEPNVVYINKEVTIGTTVKKLGVGGGTGDKLAIKLLTGSHPGGGGGGSGAVTSVNAMGLLLPTHYDGKGDYRIFEVEGSTTKDYTNYSLSGGGGSGKIKINGMEGFTLHHDFGADKNLYNQQGDLTDRHIQIRVVTFVAKDGDTRVTHTYVDPDGNGFQPFYSIRDQGQFIKQKEARTRGSAHLDYRRDGVYDLQDEFIVRPIVPPE